MAHTAGHRRAQMVNRQNRLKLKQVEKGQQTKKEYKKKIGLIEQLQLTKEMQLIEKEQ